MTTVQSRCLLLTAAFFCGVLGCSDRSNFDVRGEVRYENEPVKDGVITFRSKAGRYAAARIVDGAYVVEDASTLESDTYTVSITATRETGTRTATETTLSHNAGDVITLTEQYIPAQYNEESTLTVTLEPSQSSYDFDLLPPGK